VVLWTKTSRSFSVPLPKCARCRHHGIIVPKKGHTKICPFLKCQCWKCYLITERTKIAALQREMKRAMKETRPGARRVNAQGDKAFGTSNPDGGAPSTSEPMCPPPGGSPEKGAPAYPWSRPEAGGHTHHLLHPEPLSRKLLSKLMKGMNHKKICMYVFPVIKLLCFLFPCSSSRLGS
uniref:DM domain-containing protein n=1 Tax=Haplochromis burtoni TaxID=8153 RepID=A0A3Q3CWC3_HAPBU